MSGSPNLTLQEAIVARLDADAELQALGVDVFDDVPDDAAMPYVVIGAFTGTPRDTMGRTGRNTTVTLHVWTQAEGKFAAEEIANRVDELLNRWTPTLSDGWESVQMLHDFGPEVIEDPSDEEGLVRHGIVRYRVHVQKEYTAI